MLRSMYSGISGMKGFQTQLDTIGNNIANVNTYGYKKGRVTFQDMMSQTVSGAQGPTAAPGEDPGVGINTRGGLNPSQVGLGSQIGSIDTIHTQGNRQTTNRPLDIALEGDGMFVLAEGTEENPIDTVAKTFNDGLEGQTLSFSRAGNFYLDNDGAIVNNNGQYLVGEAYEIDPDAEVNESLGEAGVITIPADAQSFSIQNNGIVNYIDAQGRSKAAGQVRLAQFSNMSGLQKIGSNTFQNTDNAGLSTFENDGVFDTFEDMTVPGQNGAAQMVSGALEMSNVDLAESFTEMITAQRGFQANTRIITTSDEILQELVNLKR
ncbi:flagellar basal body rod protein FlgG [Halobacillus litoralis]|uniref:flagellar basal body rod protein FlgG n=1 Tax=Halobacillus litoralis TaxID=45668 RepID=UPI001CD57C4B|nr:flagellar basal body rod protein FlgG [Halobacillus litoralis]MCA0969135.1 flagellar basal body rod protein FlgG [Halobacillus litoralis]